MCFYACLFRREYLAAVTIPSQQQQAQLKELFRLADPDHSKSIDPKEFRDFLDDLQTLESEPALLSRQGGENIQIGGLFA